MATQQARLFFALPLDSVIIRTVTNAGRLLSSSQLCRVVPKERLHITLLFLGDVPVQHIPELLSFQPKSGPISIKLGRPAFFPSKGPARVYTISIEEAKLQNNKQGPLHTLHQELAEFCMLQNTTYFRPHITLAYANRSATRSTPGPDTGTKQGEALRSRWLSTSVPAVQSTISRCVLLESQQVSGGREYIPLKYYDL